MVRILKPQFAVQPERLLAAALLAFAAVAGRLAARLLPPQRGTPTREFGTIEIDGRTVGAVYEDGRLVAVLPDVARL